MAVEIRQGALRAETLVEALLTLARSDRGVAGQEFVDLATATEDALDQAAQVIRDRGVVVEASLCPAETTGDRVLVERMVANLVDNAARHNVDGGLIRVATGRRDGSVFVEVSNSGPEIPEDVVPSLLEPFRRMQDRVDLDGGVGLGLSIVRSVTTAHHGQFRAHSRSEGGLEVVVSLPVPDGGPQGAS